MSLLESLKSVCPAAHAILSTLKIQHDGREYSVLEYFDNTLCSHVFPPAIRESYLSHWKSAIEGLILQQRQFLARKVLSQRQAKENFSSEDLAFLMNSLYKIVIVVKDIATSGVVIPDKFDRLDIIIVNGKMNVEERRVTVAHELGHIIINRYLEENKKFLVPLSKDQKEALANFFMYHILQDKAEFYKKQAASFIKIPSKYKEIYDNIVTNFGSIVP